MEDEDYPGLDEEQERECRECGASLDGYRLDALYCSDACRKRYTRHEKRLEDRRNSYLSSNSLNYAELSIDELHALMQEAPARRNTRELVDEAEDVAGPGTFSDIWHHHETVDNIRATYERRMEPYRAQMRRNPGVKAKGLVELETKRDQEIARLERSYDYADAVARANANEPQRIVRAHEREAERAALDALGAQRPGRARYEGRMSAPQRMGRATTDIWRWI